MISDEPWLKFRRSQIVRCARFSSCVGRQEYNGSAREPCLGCDVRDVSLEELTSVAGCASEGRGKQGIFRLSSLLRA